MARGAPIRACGRVAAMPRRFLGLLAAIALQVVALVLAHDVVYLARFGSRYREALWVARCSPPGAAVARAGLADGTRIRAAADDPGEPRAGSADRHDAGNRDPRLARVPGGAPHHR